MRILIVEDDRAIRELMQDVLARPNVAFAGAGTVREAQALLQSIGYDFVLLDNHLPDGLGLTLLPLARRTARHVGIVTSDWSSEEVASAARANGNTPVLPKPFSEEALLQLVFGEKLSNEGEQGPRCSASEVVR